MEASLRNRLEPSVDRTQLWHQKDAFGEGLDVKLWEKEHRLKSVISESQPDCDWCS